MPDEDASDIARPRWVPVILGLLDIAKAALWPGLVLVLFLSLYHPLHALLVELPNVLGRADVITVGQLNVKLNKALTVEASPSIREAVHGAGGDAIARLIQLNGIYFVCAGNAEYSKNKAADDDLLARHLVSIDPKPDPVPEKNCYDVRLTDMGTETRNFLITLLGKTLNGGSG